MTMLPRLGPCSAADQLCDPLCNVGMEAESLLWGFCSELEPPGLCREAIFITGVVSLDGDGLREAARLCVPDGRSSSAGQRV